MPHYVRKQLTRYNHPKPKRIVNTPLQPLPRKYGPAAQEPAPPDDSPLLSEKEKRFIQQVTESFLYYGRAVDSIILHALSTIASQQSNPTENTLKITRQFLDYISCHPESTIRFHASDMILNCHSDASYLTAPKARSRAGGHFFLGSLLINGKPINLNGPIHSLCSILKFVAASAAEAELGSLFLNAKGDADHIT